MATGPPLDECSRRLSCRSSSALTEQADTVELSPRRCPTRTSDPSDVASDEPARGPDPTVGLLRYPRAGAVRRGLVVRARRVQARGDDSVVKLRPIDPAQRGGQAATDDRVWHRGRRHARRLRLLGSLKSAETSGSGTCSGGAADPKLFTSPRPPLFAEHAPEGVELDDLSMLGPINVFRRKCTPAGSAQRMVGGSVALPRQHAHPRALDEVQAARRSRLPPRYGPTWAREEST